MIKIQCASEPGFRRGGIHHPNGESCYPEDFFTTEDLALIQAEPRLMVQTGLKPDAPGTMSMAELKAALGEAKAEFGATDPRELLVSRLIAVQAEAKDDTAKPKGKKAE